MQIMYIESFENHGDEGLLAEPDVANIALAVDFNAHELASLAVIGTLVFFTEPGVTFDWVFGNLVWVQH